MPTQQPTPKPTPMPTPQPTPQPTPGPTPQPTPTLPFQPSPPPNFQPTPSPFSSQPPATSPYDSSEPQSQTPRPYPTHHNTTLSKSSTGAIAGGVVGGLCFIVLIFLACVVLWRIKRNSNNNRNVAAFVETGRIPNNDMPFRNTNSALWLSNVTVGKRLGGGNFGDVYRGVWDTTPVALKKTISGTDFVEFEREASMLHSLRHPNVVNFLGLYRDTNSSECYIVTEFMAGGGLDDVLKSRGKSMTTLDKLAIAIQIATGAVYISGKGVIHRDIASRNVLFDGSSVAKIGDLGMSREVGNMIATETLRQRGDAKVYQPSGNTLLPIRWCSPEVLQAQTFSTASDVWAFGVVLWEIFSNGETPFSNIRDAADVYVAVVQGERLQKPAKCPERIYQLMHWCWNAEPPGRPTFHQIHAELQLAIEDEQQHASTRRSVFYEASIGRRV